MQRQLPPLNTETHPYPLHLAANENDTLRITELLDQKADVNATDEFGQTALYFASFESTAAVKLLLERKADINAVTHRNGDKEFAGVGCASPIHVATSLKSMDILKTLIQNNANLELRDQQDFTPLDVAIFDCQYSIAQLLIEAKANIEQNLNGKNSVYQRLVHFLDDRYSIESLNSLVKKLEPFSSDQPLRQKVFKEILEDQKKSPHEKYYFVIRLLKDNFERGDFNSLKNSNNELYTEIKSFLAYAKENVFLPLNIYKPFWDNIPTESQKTAAEPAPTPKQRSHASRGS